MHATLLPLQFSSEEKVYLESKVTQLKATWETNRESQVKTLTLQLASLNDRLHRLTDAYVDRLIEKPLFEERKTALLMERTGLEEQLAQIRDGTSSLPHRLAKFLELAGNAYLTYQVALPEEKRDFLKITTSNRLVEAKNVDVELTIPFREVANRFHSTHGAPYRDIPRTWDELLPRLIECLKASPDLLRSPLDLKMPSAA